MSELNRRTFGLIHHFDDKLPQLGEDRTGNPYHQHSSERAAGP
jgi:hypothetical protein